MLRKAVKNIKLEILDQGGGAGAILFFFENDALNCLQYKIINGEFFVEIFRFCIWLSQFFLGWGYAMHTMHGRGLGILLFDRL